MRTPANTMPPVNLDIHTKIIAVFVFLDSKVKTVKEVGVWGWSNYSYLFTVTVSQRLQTNNRKTSLLVCGGVKTRLQPVPWENWPSEYFKLPLLSPGRIHLKFTWGNSHRREFHTGMTFYFVSRLHYDWVFSYLVIWRYTSCWWNTRKIQNRKHYACATRSSLPADRFHTETRGRFTFTWYRCEISYRSEILAPVQLPRWLTPAWHFVVVSCKQM